jgi:glycosyltransferase involved in cell wall biosynthesis
MRIVSIVAGAGGMYCGACIHASTLVSALRRAGEDALLVPVYTPVRTEEAEEEGLATRRVAFGGLNVYLQQESVLARHTPWFLDRLLDHPVLLRWLGRRSGSTRPESLGPLCVSMLQGEEGCQRKELRKLLDWLKRELRPDVVHLSTALLAGMAGPIARTLGVPVVCTLSGEDGFVERLPEPYASQARAALSRGCRELAALVALNRYYADLMAEYLAVPRERISVIEPGLNLAGHRAALQSPTIVKDKRSAGPTIGFLARVCPDKGLHVLAEAFALLSEKGSGVLFHFGEDGSRERDTLSAEMEKDSRPLGPPQLIAAGYLADADRSYLAQIQSRLAARGLGDRFEYRGCLERNEKIAFLQSLDVMCLPTVPPESKGLPVLEAWANGVPVVVTDHGALAELVRDTGGGLLVPPDNAAALAAAIEELIQDPARTTDLGRRGQMAVHSRYHADRMARDTIALYRRILGPS